MDASTVIDPNVATLISTIEANPFAGLVLLGGAVLLAYLFLAVAFRGID